MKPGDSCNRCERGRLILLEEYAESMVLACEHQDCQQEYLILKEVKHMTEHGDPCPYCLHGKLEMGRRSERTKLVYFKCDKCAVTIQAVRGAGGTIKREPPKNAKCPDCTGSGILKLEWQNRWEYECYSCQRPFTLYKSEADPQAATPSPSQAEDPLGWTVNTEACPRCSSPKTKPLAGLDRWACTVCKAKFVIRLSPPGLDAVPTQTYNAKQGLTSKQDWRPEKSNPAEVERRERPWEPTDRWKEHLLDHPAEYPVWSPPGISAETRLKFMMEARTVLAHFGAPSDVEIYAVADHLYRLWVTWIKGGR